MNIDKAEFLANLRLTQAYCEQQLQQFVGQPAAALRSLNPDFGSGKLFLYEANQFRASEGSVPPVVVEWQQGADPNDEKLMAAIFAQQLREKSLISDSNTGVPKGRILLIEYDQNIADGAVAVETEGFVDSQDFPPIDTWFYRSQVYAEDWILFAWVPEKFVAQAQVAAEVQFLSIIHWLEEWAPAQYRWLLDVA